MLGEDKAEIPKWINIDIMNDYLNSLRTIIDNTYSNFLNKYTSNYDSASITLNDYFTFLEQTEQEIKELKVRNPDSYNLSLFEPDFIKQYGAKDQKGTLFHKIVIESNKRLRSTYNEIREELPIFRDFYSNYLDSFFEYVNQISYNLLSFKDYIGNIQKTKVKDWVKYQNKFNNTFIPLINITIILMIIFCFLGLCSLTIYFFDIFHKVSFIILMFVFNCSMVLSFFFSLVME